MANTANTARKPAAAKPAAAPLSIADKLAAACKGVTYPAADNGAAWLALLAALPAIAAAVDESRAGKYKGGKGLLAGASDMLSLTPLGAPLAASGTGKNGKPNAQAATCMALAAAAAALQSATVCKAAVAFFALTDSKVLATFHGCKATDGNGKATGPRYIGRDTAPCPAWLGGYINGNVRADFFKRH